MLLGEDDTIIATGSPGGSRIINIVLQLVSNIIDHGMNVAKATQTTRFHHQWLPDELRIEDGLEQETTARLVKWGHIVRPTGPIGSTQTVMMSKGVFQGASDPRIGGALTLGLSGNSFLQDKVLPRE
ncbi:MAG: hypothetical protein CMP30_03345 [Roseibacillus sp.]|nr:hypothetical protein [Roseibacillus sp.]